MTALQRLSLSRKALPSSPASGRLAALAARNAPDSGASSPSGADSPTGPKLSKLATLAKARSAAAATPTTLCSAPSSLPSSPATPPPAGDKPLSKLQAKLLAARQAKAKAAGSSPSTGGATATSNDVTSPGAQLGQTEPVEDPMVAAGAAALDALFGSTPTAPTLHFQRPSAFASLLVTSEGAESVRQVVVEPTDLSHAETYAGFGGGGDGLEDLRRAFETLSPDDVVAEKRKGTNVASRTGDGPVVAVGKGRK